MALNNSGPMSLGGSIPGQSIALELGKGATEQISLGDSNVRTLAGKPSGAITMPTDFYGKSVLPPPPLVMTEANSFWVTIENTNSIPAVPNSYVVTMVDVSGWNNNANWQNPSTASYPLYSASTVNPYLTLYGGSSNQYNASVGSTALQVIPTDSASDMTLQLVWAVGASGGTWEISHSVGGVLEWSLLIVSNNAVFHRKTYDVYGQGVGSFALNCTPIYNNQTDRYQNLFVKVQRRTPDTTATRVWMQYGYADNPNITSNGFAWYNGNGLYNYGNSGSGQLQIKAVSGEFRFKSFRYWRTAAFDEGSPDSNLNGNNLYIKAMNQLIILPNGSSDPTEVYTFPQLSVGSSVSYYQFNCIGYASQVSWSTSTNFWVSGIPTGPPAGGITVDSVSQCTVSINPEYMSTGTYTWTLWCTDGKNVGFRNLSITLV